MILKEGPLKYSRIFISDFVSDRTNCWSLLISYVYNAKVLFNGCNIFTSYCVLLRLDFH